MYHDLVFYALIALITAGLAECSVKFKGFLNGFFSFTTIFIPSIVSGIRYGIGTDFLGVYLPEFNFLKFFPDYTSRMEFGYVWLNKLVITLGGGFQLVVFLVAFITILFIYLAVKQYKDNISVGLGMLVFMLLYFQLSFNLVRQVAAMGIVFYALKYIFNRKFWKFCFFIFLAVSFHFSAILVFPFYFLFYLYGKKEYTWLSISTFIIMIYVTLNYETLFNPLVLKIGIISKYEPYLRQTRALQWSFGILVRTLPFVLPGIFYYKKMKENHQMLFHFNFVVLGSIIQLTSYMSTNFTSRTGLYFSLSQIIIVPYFFRLGKKHHMTWIGLLVILSVVFLWYYDFFFIGANQTVPFQTFLNGYSH
ncbi:EpsG family protein [Desulfosporosinus sp. BG]|uniref:EpsG family protein n=1 Tax=Desulfosporosinus sp. BG TaxID=1633135 RepID=UPI00083A27B1|nr:EpsG family protein [Desulfosporosinus sp. BG]ODA40294.1 capsular polysaccharide biosynthesis protein [Desulfosporosinus sp. BG]